MSIVLETPHNPILETLARLCGPDNPAPSPDTSPASFLHHCLDTVALHLYVARKSVYAYHPTDPLLTEFRSWCLALFRSCKPLAQFQIPDAVLHRLDEEESRSLDAEHAQGLHATADPRCCACAAAFPEGEHESHPACTLTTPSQAAHEAA